MKTTKLTTFDAGKKKKLVSSERVRSDTRMYRVPPFRMLDVGDHSMERYVKHAMTWAEAAKAGAADVE